MPDERTKISAEASGREFGETARRTQADTSGVRVTVRCTPPGFASSAGEEIEAIESARLLAHTPPRSRFDDHGEIGRGGMGQVRRALDTVLLREVAMKVMDPDVSAQPGLALRFLEEAQIMGQLEHPNIVPVYDLGVEAGLSGGFFTMKLVEGRTLTELIVELHNSAARRPELEPVLQVLLKVCDAVAFAHSRGVIHRDLKPDNVMVGTHGQVYVMDWGVALLLDGERPSTTAALLGTLAHMGGDAPGSIIGTVDFMAPEQALGKTSEIDERTDVFGLGGILYFLLTGQGPNVAATRHETLANAQNGSVPRPHVRKAWVDLPPGLCAITMKALSKSKDARYGTASELKADLEQFLRGGGWFMSAVFEPGSVIVRQGDVAECAYIIVQGRCQVLKDGAEGQTVLRELGPGDVFGETAVLTQGPRTATIVALDTVTVKIVTRDALEAELEKNPWVGAFMKALATRFRDIDERLSVLNERVQR